MGKAYKCDRCGRLFSPYKYNLLQQEKRYTSIVKMEMKSVEHYDKRDTFQEGKERKFDLCRDCDLEFKKFMAGTSVAAILML